MLLVYSQCQGGGKAGEQQVLSVALFLQCDGGGGECARVRVCPSVVCLSWFVRILPDMNSGSERWAQHLEGSEKGTSSLDSHFYLPIRGEETALTCGLSQRME